MNSDSHEQLFLSIIIPALNEEERLPETLSRIVTFLEARDYPAEVVVVNNGSTDLTDKIISEFASRHPCIRSCTADVRGKGSAIKAGVMSARGDYFLICDADLAVPIEEVSRFLPPQCIDYDVAIGSRQVLGARRYGEPFHRHVMGRVFNLIVQLLILPGIHDTQCGFKCFRRVVAHDLFLTSTIMGWGFDVEILYISQLRGYRIIEVPVSWYYRERSKISPIRDPWKMLREVLIVRRNARRGAYSRILNEAKSDKPPIVS